MTQYEELVEKQRIKIEAEKWASGIKCIHSHSSDSMWYASDRSDDFNLREEVSISMYLQLAI